jgi:hypothetical protein
MKRPWVIGLLSVVPGLGLIILGQLVEGCAVMVGTTLLALLSVVIPSAELSVWFFVVGLIVWAVQLWYTVDLSLRLRRNHEAASLTPTQTALNDDSRRWAKEALEPLLTASEHLSLAFSGHTQGVDIHALANIVLALLGGGAGGELRTTYVGITNDCLVFAKAIGRPKASDLRRVRLKSASLVRFKEHDTALLHDELVIAIEGRGTLRLGTSKPDRQTIRELGLILSK